MDRHDNDSDSPPARRSDGAKIVHLLDITPPNSARIVAGMRNYWRSRCGGSAVPSRADIQPQGMRQMLDFAFLVERVGPGAARFRLAGRHLVDLMGMEVRGMPICAFMAPSFRGRLSDVLETVFHAPQIADLTIASPPAYGQPALAGRLLVLPLRTDTGGPRRALGCLVAEGQVGTAPRLFDLTGEALSPVIDGGVVMQPTASGPGFSEGVEIWTPQPEPAPVLGGGHLRLVVDND